MKKLLPIAAMLALSACTANEYGGINHVRVSFNDDGKPSEAVLYGGKEQEAIELKVTGLNGLNVEYRANGVSAFEGQKIRAELEKAQVEVLGKATPSLTDALVKIVTGGL